MGKHIISKTIIYIYLLSKYRQNVNVNKLLETKLLNQILVSEGKVKHKNAKKNQESKQQKIDEIKTNDDIGNYS